VFKGRNIGLVHLAANFSHSLQLFNDDPDYDHHGDGTVHVFVEKTDQQKAFLIEQMIVEAYESFVENLLVDCGKSRKAGKLFIPSKASIGKLDFDFKATFLAGMLLT
jgi:hypothetical protein